MADKLKKFLVILALTLIPTLAVWLPFFLRMGNFWGIPLPQNGMATIVANYDGPLFLVVAKTFYSRELIKANFQFPLPTEYYASHFPLFPTLIKIFSYLLGFPYSMLVVTILSSALAIYFFHKLATDYLSQKDAWWLTFFFSIFPARWLVVRSVGSAEPFFIAAIIASLYYFQNKKYLLAGVWGGVAQLTKSPAFLLFISYLFALVFPHLKDLFAGSVKKFFQEIQLSKVYPILLIPITLLGLFFFYSVRYGDFLAYFHSGDNIHLFFPPFSIFNYSAPWVGTFWLEEVIFVYLIAASGLFLLIKKGYKEMAWFVGIFLFSIVFVAHRDVVRYALPTVPFLILGFADFLTKKEFKYILALLILPIYLFTLAFISQNVMPISNWAPFL